MLLRGVTSCPGRSFADTEALDRLPRGQRGRLELSGREIGVTGDDAVDADRPGEEDEVVVVLVTKDCISGLRVMFDAAEQCDLVDQLVDFVEGDEATELGPAQDLVEFSEELRRDDNFEVAVAERPDECG